MKSDQNWFQTNAERFSGKLLFDERLAKHTYYRIGGPAAILAVPVNEQDIRLLIEGIQKTGCSYFILGNGSNVLAADEGFAGLVIRTHKLNLDVIPLAAQESSQLVSVGVSVSAPALLRKAVQEGWGGLEFLAGIPGAMGGAVIMNAGTHAGEAQDRLRAVEVYDLLRDFSGEIRQVYQSDQLKFAYRKNLFLPQGSLVNAVVWEVRREPPTQVKAMVEDMLLRRKMTQPIDFPSCGSVFRNPKGSGFLAWQVIDRIGLRGYRVGDAQFSEKHSNFIINLDKAQAVEVRTLIELAKLKAKQELNIDLLEEVIYLGIF